LKVENGKTFYEVVVEERGNGRSRVVGDAKPLSPDAQGYVTEENACAA